ncbi:YolD-like family protein [Neobacillus drentensis]|uniref:YolD-like family protein n=1 Tax=Neobacillus drentensis TaxID=220684 RepID=UPI002FFFE412
MAIRDRGVKKWQGAFFMPEQAKMHREIWRDDQRQAKPILDDYQTEEFDLRILKKAVLWCGGVIMPQFNSDLLRIRYDSLEDARFDRRASEVIITDNYETFYCVTAEVYNDGPRQLGYDIVE